MKVGDKGGRNGEPVRRKDELVGPAVESVDLVVGGDIGLESARDRDSYGQNLMSGMLGGVDLVRGLRRDYQAFGFHLML